MATTAVSLDSEIVEQASKLTSAQKREALDFICFLASRRTARRSGGIPQKKSHQSLEAIIDCAPGGNGETDLSINHDHYLYGFERS